MAGFEPAFVLERGRRRQVVTGPGEPEAVRIAAKNLRQDLELVFGRVPEAEDGSEAQPVSQILIATAPWSGCRREAYRLEVREGVLYIYGADRRGTVYGIYELSQMLGVSPWHFWADVPVKEKSHFALEGGFEKEDAPSVDYRGIFLNDEEELERWVQAHMGEDTIGVKTYEKVFELLLRLKANYIWPAMHVNSFNAKRENGELAERMGIVVGTSHCDMLMRSNNREWLPWLEAKGYGEAVYDYSIPGRNREILREYWRESVEQNRDFEVCYTLGMRGIHDSGFETGALSGLSGEALRKEKIRLLQQVITDQREILKETLGRETMTTFIPYKEVLELYDGGLEIPEDVTLVWANDNYGYIRRFPSEKEKKRRGGNGIYYHNSYWAPPGMSYVFLCSIPLAHTAYELRKAYGQGIRKLWVLNVGALKPLEQETEFFLRLAWEIGKEGALTEDVEAFAADWIDRNFSGGIGRETSALLNEFSQLTNVRKLELMDYDAFSQYAYGDEAVSRIHRYEKLFQRGNALYGSLPQRERDAFFQLVLFKIHAAYFTNLAWYWGDRSTYAQEQGRGAAADCYVRKSREMEDARRRLLVYYNKRMAQGKWDGIVDPEGFPPPRAAMLPLCTPALAKEAGQGMQVTLWNREEKLVFTRPGVKWLELGNTGDSSFSYGVRGPEWLQLSQTCGVLETEERILVSLKEYERDCRGVIEVCPEGDLPPVRIAVEVLFSSEGCENREEDGMAAVEASQAESSSFRRIPWLGRDRGSLVEACESFLPGECGKGEPLCYQVSLLSRGEFLLEVHRFPSLNATGQIRVGVAVDGGEIQILASPSNDEHRGTWRENVRNSVERLYLKLPHLEPGLHQICFYPIDRYFAFSRFVIYTKPRRDNNLAGFSGEQALPLSFDPEGFAREFYGEIVLRPRPVEYARVELEKDDLCKSSLILQDEVYGETVTADVYLQIGKRPFAERAGMIRIDAAAALAGSAYACFSQKEEGERLWRHCASLSFGRSGLAMYVRKRGYVWRDGKDAPALHYRIQCEGGAYTVWLYACFGKKEESFYGLLLDGEETSPGKLYGGGCLWRYEAEQIYRWVPLTVLSLSQGEHLFGIYGKGPGLLIDRICLIKGGRLPPMDTEWEADR